MQGNALSQQQGMALVLSLIFLTIVTLLSLSSMQGAMIQNRMAASQRDHTVALQAAEAALRDAENQLQRGAAPSDRWTTHDIDNDVLSQNPRYRVQPLTRIGSRSTNSSTEIVNMLYRIEAQGFGVDAGTNVTLEALYVREQPVEVNLP